MRDNPVWRGTADCDLDSFKAETALPVVPNMDRILSNVAACAEARPFPANLHHPFRL